MSTECVCQDDPPGPEAYGTPIMNDWPVDAVIALANRTV